MSTALMVARLNRVFISKENLGAFCWSLRIPPYLGSGNARGNLKTPKGSGQSQERCPYSVERPAEGTVLREGQVGRLAT